MAMRRESATVLAFGDQRRRQRTIYFTRPELNQLLGLYSHHVIRGEWRDYAIDYAVDPARADAFHAAIRRYWPALADGALQPGYAGIRPKISGPGVPAADFLVHGPETYGVPGLVNLYGIESPGLTSSLPLADAVVDRLAG